MLGPDNAFWDSDEWVSWDEINQQIQYKEWRARYPKANLALIPIFEQLLTTAEDYYRETGLHLQVYGDIGELYGAITYGIKLHKNYAQGSDGRLGNDFIEVKTISPFKTRDEVLVDLKGHFNELLVVNINEDFKICHRLVDRKLLPKTNEKRLRIKWSDLEF
ncbi:hypothetical protein [Sneathiella sp. HT1-7]|jgi:hypothetical protein|uniref:hypothetical protein n=1 Tax=Sneathiella sp. HT1-7 TaxID=2887192 RepID=UPI001D13E7A9|nr:hypothetical protein [Sneathiella sp. HT1-7]MCC3305443.1 hypothetical protein [Sneathiella sp. HT1-7]